MAKKHYNQTVGFADRLTDAMREKNINITQLAEKVGMERKSVSGYVNGYGMLNEFVFARMCKVLKVSADYLLFGERK